LMKLGANPVALYDWLYLEKPEVRLMKYDFQSRIKIEDGVAFLKNSKEDVAKHPDVDISVMSKEVAGSMLEIEGVLIGANFTFSSEQGVILGEFRSRGVKIVDVAKKYGGGGHDMACGASLANWDLVDAVIEDFKKMVKLRG
jgi:phosphoesterase RecJ-like protein